MSSAQNPTTTPAGAAPAAVLGTAALAATPAAAPAAVLGAAALAAAEGRPSSAETVSALVAALAGVFSPGLGAAPGAETDAEPDAETGAEPGAEAGAALGAETDAEAGAALDAETDAALGAETNAAPAPDADTGAGAPVADAPAPDAPVAWHREENVAGSELSAADVDALFDSCLGAGHAAGASAMSESDMDSLYRALGGPGAAPWLPAWARESPPGREDARGYSVGDVYEPGAGDGDTLGDALQALRDLEVATATIDDTTVALRDKVDDLAGDVRDLQAQLYSTSDSLQAQTAALTEEFREIRFVIGAMRTQLATLILCLAGAPPAGAGRD